MSTAESFTSSLPSAGKPLLETFMNNVSKWVYETELHHIALRQELQDRIGFKSALTLLDENIEPSEYQMLIDHIDENTSDIRINLLVNMLCHDLLHGIYQKVDFSEKFILANGQLDILAELKERYFSVVKISNKDKSIVNKHFRKAKKVSKNHSHDYRKHLGMIKEILDKKDVIEVSS